MTSRWIPCRNPNCDDGMEVLVHRDKNGIETGWTSSQCPDCGGTGGYVWELDDEDCGN